MCSRFCAQLVPNLDSSLYLVSAVVMCSSGYHSPLNDFQRSEGRELVPTSWNSARVSLLYGLNLEECAQRCSQSLECRYPRLWFHLTPINTVAEAKVKPSGGI